MVTDDKAVAASGMGPRRAQVAGARDSRTALSVAALAVAVLALALAGGAILRPAGAPVAAGADAPSAPGYFDDVQRDDARAKVCNAFDVVRAGVAINTNATAPGGPDDITGGIAVGANARLAMLGGGQYLLARIDPATPAQLAKDASGLSNLLMDIGATSISGVSTTDSGQSARMAEAQSLSSALTDQCSAG